MRTMAFLLALATLASMMILLNMPTSEAKSGEAPDWQAIADAKAPELPRGQTKIEWREDLKDALAEAKKSGRPLFITMRCLPCKQCSDFDKDVLEGGDLLSPLLKQFITVRLTTMAGVDERILPFQEYQDLDLSWWGYFLSDKAALYGVYGGMDITGDAARISPKGLAATMQRVLDHHYNEKRSSWGIDRGEPKTSGKGTTPESLKGWKSWSRTESGKAANKGECLHCHWVNDVIRQPEIDGKKFDKAKDFYIWPYPENLGFTLDRDDGLLVKSVEKDSPAASAGIEKGDRIVAAGGARVFSEADVRAAIKNIPYKGGKAVLEVRHADKVARKIVELKDGWKVSDLGWRKSVNEAQLGAHFGFSWPLKASDNERKQRGIEKGTMAVKPWIPNNADARGLPAVKAGLKASDIITAVNGKSPDVTARAFGIFFRMNFEPGDKIALTVKDDKGKQREIEYTCK